MISDKSWTLFFFVMALISWSAYFFWVKLVFSLYWICKWFSPNDRVLFHWLLIPLFHLDYARIKWQWFFIIISDHMKFYIPFPNAPYWEILLSIQKCNGGYSNVQPQPSKVTPFSKYECEKVNLLLCYFLQISLSK